jgi:hypothetical protein
MRPLAISQNAIAKEPNWKSNLLGHLPSRGKPDVFARLMESRRISALR